MFYVLTFPLIASATFGLDLICCLKRCHGSLCRVSQPNTTSARQRWRFCREPSGYDLAYKKDRTGTFATQFISGNPKAGMQIQGREGFLQRVMIHKKGCSQKRKHKWVFLKGRYRAGSIYIKSAWRFGVKKGVASAGLSAIMQECGLKPVFPSQPALLVNGFRCVVLSCR